MKTAKRGAGLGATGPITTLGIDEAGRGPVLGPLVVAAVALRPARAAALRRRGVCDSKRFGAGPEARLARRQLAGQIRRLAEWVGVEVHDHLEVDRFTSQGLLNDLERRAARRLITSAPAVTRIVADGMQVFGPLRAEIPHLRAFDEGESVHVAVAAASIVAKDLRDELFAVIAERYREEFGELRGGGYVNAATADFLRRHHRRHGCLPAETRRSWGWKVLLELSTSDGAHDDGPADSGTRGARSSVPRRLPPWSETATEPTSGPAESIATSVAARNRRDAHRRNRRTSPSS